GLAVGCLMRFLSALTRLLGVLLSRRRRPERCFKRSDLGLPVVQLRVENANLPQITTLEALQLGTQVGQFKFALCQGCSYGTQFLAFAVEFFLLRSQLADDRTGHWLCLRGCNYP